MEDGITEMDSTYTLTDIHFVHTIWIAMLLTGVLGGLVSYFSDTNDSSCNNKHIVEHVITGVLATFMVPLFLQMIGSTLLKELTPDHYKFFVFLGFCSAAGFISQHFARTVSQKMLRDVNQKVTTANINAEEAKKMSERTVHKSRQLKIDNLRIKGALSFQANQFKKAKHYLESYLKHDESDAHSLWRLAYIEKRLGNFEMAYKYVNDAIKVDIDSSVLYFNRACYAALLNKDVADIIDDLGSALKYDTENKITSCILDDLKDDGEVGDLIALKNKPEFVAFLEKNNITVN